MLEEREETEKLALGQGTLETGEKLHVHGGRREGGREGGREGRRGREREEYMYFSEWLACAVAHLTGSTRGSFFIPVSMGP